MSTVARKEEERMTGLSNYYRYLSPHVTILVTTGMKKDMNIITLAWHMPVSIEPPA